MFLIYLRVLLFFKLEKKIRLKGNQIGEISASLIINGGGSEDMRFPHKPGTDTHCSLFIISEMTRSRHDMNMLRRLEQARIHTYTGTYKYTKKYWAHRDSMCYPKGNCKHTSAHTQGHAGIGGRHMRTHTHTLMRYEKGR